MIESMDPVLFWFLLGLALMLAELVLPGFVILFFGIGAWVTAAAIALGLLPSFNGQLIVFLIASVGSLLLFRKKGRAIFVGRVAGTPDADLEDVVGRKAVVVAEIRPQALDGKVEFNGTHWQAESDTTIAVGTTVEIARRSNLILFVKPLSSNDKV